MLQDKGNVRLWGLRLGLASRCLGEAQTAAEAKACCQRCQATEQAPSVHGALCCSQSHLQAAPGDHQV